MRPLVPAMCLLASGCVELLPGDGFVDVTVVSDELEPGTRVEVDGWTITFEQMALSASHFEVTSVDGTSLLESSFALEAIAPAETTDPNRPMIGATTAPSAPARAILTTGPAPAAAAVESPVVETLLAKSGALLVSGIATQGTRTKRFEWVFRTAATFTCDLPDRTWNIEVHLSADHLLRTDAAGHGPVQGFRSIVDADRNGDGVISEVDLMTQTANADVYEIAPGSGMTLWDWLERQSIRMVHLGTDHCAIEEP